QAKLQSRNRRVPGRSERAPSRLFGARRARQDPNRPRFAMEGSPVTIAGAVDALVGAAPNEEVPKRRLPVLPVRELLEVQRSLTAVERFSRLHESPEAPLKEKYYRDLIPLERPRPGEQYAFEVDLDACTGCKACVAACHTMNGLDESELWRTVGLLHGGTPAAPAQ